MAPSTEVGAVAPELPARDGPDVEAPQAGYDGQGRSRDQEKGQANCVPSDAERKGEATLIAKAAIAGFELIKLADGTWLAQRWGFFKPLQDAIGVQAWLARVGAA